MDQTIHSRQRVTTAENGPQLRSYLAGNPQRTARVRFRFLLVGSLVRGHFGQPLLGNEHGERGSGAKGIED